MLSGASDSHNSVRGLAISSGNNWLVENNVFYNNRGFEIRDQGGDNHIIRNNTFVAGPNSAAQGIYIDCNTKNNLFENNIVVGYQYPFWHVSNKPGNTIRTTGSRRSRRNEIKEFDGCNRIRMRECGNILNRIRFWLIQRH